MMVMSKKFLLGIFKFAHCRTSSNHLVVVIASLSYNG